MNFDQKKLQLDYVKHRQKYFLVSGILIALGFIILAIMGLNLGVDFESGTRLEVLNDNNESFNTADVKETLNKLDLEPGEVLLAGANKEIAVLLFEGTLHPDEISVIRQAFSKQYGDVSLSESTVSPDIARELAAKAVYSVLLASVGVILYVTFRFEYRFAIATIIALLHDAFFVIAVFSIFRLEVDLTFIAAILTIVGYSINDTIVIFDRIRENLKLHKLKTMEDLSGIVNRSISETLPRSINTSLTTVTAATMLFLFGGESIRNFSFALMIGLLAGTYSSIFIAAQVWLVWKGRELKKNLMNPQQDL